MYIHCVCFLFSISHLAERVCVCCMLLSHITKRYAYIMFHVGSYYIIWSFELKRTTMASLIDAGTKGTLNSGVRSRSGFTLVRRIIHLFRSPKQRNRFSEYRVVCACLLKKRGIGVHTDRFFF